MKRQSTYLKTGLFIAVIGALSACTDSDDIASSISAPETQTISGTVAKGIVIGGIVNVHAVVDGVVDTANSLGSAVTDSTGRYTTDLISALTNQTHLVVRVTADTSTRVTCDFPDCNGNDSTAAFGSTIEVDDRFELRSLVAPTDNTKNQITVNPNVFTTAASDRALNLASMDNRQVSTNDINTANSEMAAIVNNILGTEGTNRAITGTELSTLPVVDLTQPRSMTIDTDSGKATQLAFLNASTYGLLTPSEPSISSAIDRFSNAFANDGSIDVNSTAANLSDTEFSVDLVDLATNVTTLTDDISDLLDPVDFVTLEDLVGDISLTSFTNTVNQIAADKANVTDALNDPTAPIDVVTETLTASDKALEMAMQLDNVLQAADGLFSTAADDFSGTLGSVISTLELSSIDEQDVIENMGDIIILGAEFLTTSDTILEANGCTINETTKTCSVMQLGFLLEDDLPVVTSGTGTFTLTIATNTVVITALELEGNTYALTIVGDGSDLSSATSASYTIEIATVADRSQTVFSVGETSTMTGTLIDGSGQTATINLVDVTLDINNLYRFNGDVTLTQTYRSSAALFSRKVLSEAALNGAITLTSGNTDGEVLQMSANYSVDTSVLTPTGIPGSEAEETASNFYKVDRLDISITSPVSFTRRTATDSTREGTMITSDTSGSLKIIGGFQRTTPSEVTGFDLSFKLVAGGASQLLTGTAVQGAEMATFTFTNSTPGVVLALTSGDGGFSGNILVDDVEKATIDMGGVITVSVDGDGEGNALTRSFQLAVNADS